MVGRNGDGKTTLLRRDDRARGAGLRPGVPAARAARRPPAPARRARRHPHRPRGGAGRPVRPRVGGRPAHPRGGRGAARRRHPRPGRRRACPAASAAAARWPRCCWASTTWSCSTSRPTTSTWRRWPGWPTTSRRRTSALVVVTHDRWFLDAVCQWTWEVHDGVVDVYEGGYAAYVLAQAERQRQAAATEVRRRNLVRKELAWLRRGPPARTSKPKFRIDAANALIEDVPGAAGPAGAAAVRDPAARQGRHRHRGRRPRARRAGAAVPRDLAARARRPGRAGGGERRRQDLGARPAVRRAGATAGRVRHGRTVALRT